MIKEQQPLSTIHEGIKIILEKIAEEELEYARKRFNERGKEAVMNFSVTMLERFDIQVNRNTFTVEFRNK